MRHCVIICCLDKSDRIGIESCYMFHCAAVALSNFFGTAVSTVAYFTGVNVSAKSFVMCGIETAVQKVSDDDSAAQ